MQRGDWAALGSGRLSRAVLEEFRRTAVADVQAAYVRGDIVEADRDRRLVELRRARVTTEIGAFTRDLRHLHLGWPHEPDEFDELDEDAEGSDELDEDAEGSSGFMEHTWAVVRGRLPSWTVLIPVLILLALLGSTVGLLSVLVRAALG